MLKFYINCTCISIYIDSFNNTRNKQLLNNSTKLIEHLKSISKYIDTATNEEKKKLISSIIERVYVNGDTGAVNIKFKQPDN